MIERIEYMALSDREHEATTDVWQDAAGWWAAYRSAGCYGVTFGPAETELEAREALLEHLRERRSRWGS